MRLLLPILILLSLSACQKEERDPAELQKAIDTCRSVNQEPVIGSNYYGLVVVGCRAP